MKKCSTLAFVCLLAAAAPPFAISTVREQRMPSASLTATRVHDEADPTDDELCDALGNLRIIFRTMEPGPPKVSIVLTDPRGRRFGFDSIAQRAWQQLPEAAGFIDCDSPGETAECRGVVEVCGPVSGVYKLEVNAQQSTAYSLRITGRSEQVYYEKDLHSSISETEVSAVGIRGRSRDTFVLDYSRDPSAKIALHSSWEIAAAGDE